MRILDRLRNLSRKTLYIIIAIVIALSIVIIVWNSNKYKIVRDTVKSTVAKKSDSLYIVKYDSLSFDEITGFASLKNVRVTPDTNRIKKMDVADMPNFLFDIKIKSIEVRGVSTAKALIGKEMVGDSVILDHPELVIYSLKPIQKDTKINEQTEEFYKQILGNLDLIKVNTVLINNVNVSGLDFFSKQKNFDAMNANLQLEGLAIDSVSNLDTNRILFSRQVAFKLDSFFSYNNNRKEVVVNNITFSGTYKTLLFDEININRFADREGNAFPLLEAKVLKLSGINTNEIIKNKNLVVDTILCKQITFHEPPSSEISAKGKSTGTNDSTGFMNIYSAKMRHLQFADVKIVPFKKSKYSVGNIAIKVNGVQSGSIYQLTKKPTEHAKEIEIAVSKLSLKSKDKKYDYDFGNVVLNSMKKELKIDYFKIIPYKNELPFAAAEAFQQDRYQVNLSGITLSGIQIDDLLNNKIEATDLVINKTNAKIYRDLTRTLKKESKVGNYPSQMLQKLDMPINIQKATLSDAYIEYREKEEKSDSTGVVTFVGSHLTISNITNVPAVIKKNNEFNIVFKTKALGSIPLSGNFKFILNSKDGNFVVNGKTTSFDAVNLNKVSIPMALVRLKSGKINSMDFHFSGNNVGAKGSFVMKYEDLKVDVLKIDKDSKDIKKKGLVTFFANTLVKNNNPQNGKLREETPSFERNIYKSFFNLVWKTLFTGLKSTLGIPNI